MIHQAGASATPSNPAAMNMLLSASQRPNPTRPTTQPLRDAGQQVAAGRGEQERIRARRAGDRNWRGSRASRRRAVRLVTPRLTKPTSANASVKRARSVQLADQPLLATTSAMTRAAPASINGTAQASSVAPVVETSSINRTRCPATRSGRGQSKAPWTFVSRSARCSSTCGRVSRRRTSALVTGAGSRSEVGELVRDQLGLVVTTLALAAVAQRDRYDQVGLEWPGRRLTSMSWAARAASRRTRPYLRRRMAVRTSALVAAGGPQGAEGRGPGAGTAPADDPGPGLARHSAGQALRR